MAEQQKEMSFLGHLEELRWHLVRSTAAIFIFGIVLYFYMGFVVEGLNISSEIATYNFSIMIFVFISGITLSILTSILPAINMSKRNIVKEIKYE